MSELSMFMEDERLNAVITWLLAGVLWAAQLESVVDADLLWAGFAGFAAFVVVLPAIAYRNWRIMPPWEVVFLVAFPVLGRSIEVLVPYAPFVTSTVTMYVGVAAMALIVAVELHLFTAVKMSHRFAVMFVVVTTLAATGIWAVLQWFSDLYLGTGFLSTNTALMHGFLVATAAGFGGGIVFDAYFRRRRDKRLQELYEDLQ